MDDTAAGRPSQVYGHELLHYGSPPGELAACLRNVGVVRRSASRVLLVEGYPAAIETAVHRLAQVRLETGGAVQLADAWWCRPQDDRVLVVTSAASGARILRLLEQHSRHNMGLRVDSGHRLQVAAFVGRRVHDLMRAVNVYGDDGDPRTTSPCVVVPVAGQSVTWILESDSTVIACIASEDADTVHRAIEAAGHALGLARVGREAFDHFTMLERRRRSQASAR